MPRRRRARSSNRSSATTRTRRGEQIANLEKAFAALGWEVDDSPCPAIEGIEKEGKANVKKADDAVIDGVLLSGAAETEHHEIAVTRA